MLAGISIEMQHTAIQLNAFVNHQPGLLGSCKMEIIIIVTIVVVLVVSALVFDGEKSDEAEEESQPKGRALKRQRRDEWQPPTGSVQDPISKSSQKDNLSLIPEFSGDIQESTLEEVFVCYLFWDKEFVAPARPKFDWALQDAVEYMEEWLPLVEKEMSTFLEYLKVY